MFWRYSEEKFRELDRDGRIWWGKDGNNAPRIKRFLNEVKQGVVPQTMWFNNEVGNTQEAKKEVVALFGSENFMTPKPERLLRRVFDIGSKPGDIVLDSFLGSGTTAAVGQKMGRRWIGIEMGEHARTHCLPRLLKVIEGEKGGISPAVGWQGGGGFRFLRLGEPMFDADGHIHPSVRFATLASFIWMQESGAAGHGPWNSPKLGVHDGRAIYLLFNGILRDLRRASGNVLTGDVLAAIERLLPHDGPKVVYGEACRLGAARLAAAGITFKQLPYDVQAR
jgi:adenine-specific DNA-methyltransferase